MTTQKITDPAVFIADQYKQLSPNWDTLTGKEQYDIISSKYQSIHSGTTTVNGVLPPDTEDVIYRKLATSLAIAYISNQSGDNPEVMELIGIKRIFNDAEIDDPAAFIKEQFDLLSPDWDTLSGEDKLKILQEKMPATHSAPLLNLQDNATIDDVINANAGMLARLYIWIQSDYNPGVAKELGYEVS